MPFPRPFRRSRRDGWRNPAELTQHTFENWIQEAFELPASSEDQLHQAERYGTNQRPLTIVCGRCHQKYHAIRGFVARIIAYQDAPEYAHLASTCPYDGQVSISFSLNALHCYLKLRTPITVRAEVSAHIRQLYADKFPSEPVPPVIPPVRLQALADGLTQASQLRH